VLSMMAGWPSEVTLGKKRWAWVPTTGRFLRIFQVPACAGFAKIHGSPTLWEVAVAMSPDDG